MSSSTIITPITTTNNTSSTSGIQNPKTNRTLFKNIKNNLPNTPNNAPIKKNSVGIIGNGPIVNNNKNNNGIKDNNKKINSNNGGVNVGKKNILFTPSKTSMVSKQTSSLMLAENEYDIEAIKKELKSMDISTGGISPLSSPLRESSPISTIDLESVATTTPTKITDAFVAASSNNIVNRYTVDVLLSFKSANTKRPIEIDIVENHQKEIVVPLSLPTTPYNNNSNNNNNNNNTANGQKYPIFSPQISPFKIAYTQSSSTKTNNITPTKKTNSNITTPLSNTHSHHHNNYTNSKSSTKKQNPIPFSLNTATPNQKNTTPSKKSTTAITPKSNKKVNDVAAAFAAVANATTESQAVAVVDGDSNPTAPTTESPKKTPLRETDPKRLAARQRQIDIGKMTAGYKNYIVLVPKSKRKPTDPKTPNKNQVCSKRSWDGQIKKWRRQLHENYDWTGIPFNEKEVEASNNESEESTLEIEMNKLEISE
ncbi:hypothetical protein RB653_002963 [Dictyostelium firmibasis]|uniref:Histone RNA hairpin-binding protein RNA-binding domain-containing protein n=1 Tax=Dictyostelium firmibasis TaxID=79012 RepID=A0AAN7UAW2_9MYCE